jgi:hypothetical protein
MRALLVLVGLVGVFSPTIPSADPLPDPPPGEKHLVVTPGSTVTTAAGPVVAPADKSDPTFGGIYAPPDLARWDLQRLEALERERDEARAAAANAGSVLRPFAIGLGMGLVGGGLSSAVVVDKPIGVRLAVAAVPTVVGALLVWIGTR